MTKSAIRLPFVFMLLLLFFNVVQGQDTGNTAGPTLGSIRARGQVACGVNQELFGFGYLDPNTGDINGFDVDFCRALAAAIFGDVSAVRFDLLTVQDGEAALRSGELDVLFHNVSQTLTSDTTEQLDFGPPNFYDGQSVMALAEDALDTWASLEGKIICVLEGPSLMNLENAMARQGLGYEPLSFPVEGEAQQAFLDGRCDALVGNWVQLVVLRRDTDNAQAYSIWEVPFTIEPLVPVYRYGDKQWGDIIEWTIYGLIQAEALGVTSENIDESVVSANLEIAALLGSSGELGSRLGLTNNFMVEVIRQVGNYGEIYDRHLGANSLQPVPIARGINQLWTNGGLIYAPPWA
jgi:general L-amino acid transport system substrate-binding protein